MCGIFGFLTFNSALRWRLGKNDCKQKLLQSGIEGCKNRGPEGSCSIGGNSTSYDFGLGFTRLAINNVQSDGMQPFTYKVTEDSMDGIYLVCNGEIYNADEIYQELAQSNDLPELNSDCSIILILYRLFGIHYTLNRLDGVFSFIIIDTITEHMYIARDRLGIRSSYYGYANILPVYRQTNNTYGRTYVVGSNLRQTIDFFNNPNVIEFINQRDSLNIQPVIPGTFIDIDLVKQKHTINQFWSIYGTLVRKPQLTTSQLTTMSTINSYTSVVDSLYKSVKKRVTTTDRPICCLLSGGLDSSLIASMVASIMAENGHSQRLETYSIGIQGSDDLRFAKEVAKHIKSNHNEIIVTAQEMFDAIPQVVRAVESYDTTTIRASVGNYLVCKFIAEHSDAKVVFNGDGADELMGGYLYFNVINDNQTHESERMRLLNQIHYYDVLRSDKTISENGLEARTPFLDVEFVNTMFSEMRLMPGKVSQEKFYLRQSIEKVRPDLLPKSVLWRRKEAFSDGVSGANKSWKDEINDMIKKLPKVIQKQIDTVCINNSDLTREQAYYKLLFQTKICKDQNVLEDGFKQQLATRWMPRFVETNDPSARTLDIY